MAQGCGSSLAATSRRRSIRMPPSPPRLPPPDSITSSNSGAFATRINKVFKVETYDETVVVIPMGDVSDFSYKEIHSTPGGSPNCSPSTASGT